MARLRTLPERHGGAVLVLLGLLLLVGLGLRLIGVLDPIDSSYEGADAARYERIAALLYTDQRFAVPGSDAPYDWSPGAPLFYAGVYYLTGGVHVGLARLAVALVGLVTIVLAYLLGRRLNGPATGLVAALLAATYPAFVFNTGRLLSEPLAQALVPGAALAFLWAAERRSVRAWLAPGLLIGCAALVRPEYLAFGGVLALLAALNVARDRSWARGLLAGTAVAAAFLAPVAPWTVHVSAQEGRFVPVSTGAGKALFIGSHLPGDGLHRRVKVRLMERHLGLRGVTPEQADRQPMEPLLDRVAARHPQLPRDAALGRIGRESLVRHLRERPLAFAAMAGEKVRYMWRGSSGAMLSPPTVVLQAALVLVGLLGLGVLARRRRFEALLLGALVLGMTALAALVLAAPRRNLALMPLVMALAATGLTASLAVARTAVRSAAARARPVGLVPRLERQER
jgi:hypothetical protein